MQEGQLHEEIIRKENRKFGQLVLWWANFERLLEVDVEFWRREVNTVGEELGDGFAMMLIG